MSSRGHRIDALEFSFPDAYIVDARTCSRGENIKLHARTCGLICVWLIGVESKQIENISPSNFSRKPQ